jgi:small subunit ribosomal protein S20
MPNTKSAERRVRNSARKQESNRTVKSKLRTLEATYLELAQAGKKDDAAKALRAVGSAFDKAVKKGVVHPRNSDRKKSRLGLHFNKLK